MYYILLICFFAVEKLDIGDIFEPDMEDNMTTNSHHHTFPTNTHNPVKRERTISETSVKLAKVEEMTGFEKLRDGRSSIKMPKTEPMGGPGGHPGHHHHQQAHGQQQPTKSMVVSIPLPSSTSTGLQVNMFFKNPLFYLLPCLFICKKHCHALTTVS